MTVGYMLMNDPRDVEGNVLDWQAFLEEAKGWGLEAVDLFPFYLERTGTSVDAAAEAIAKLGLGIAVYCVPTDLVSADPETRRQSLDRVSTFADKAVELGVNHLFSHGGQHSHSGEAALGRYIDGLGQAADLCAQRGLLFSIENAGTLCHTHQELARCIEAVGRPNMRVTLDAGNFLLAGSDPHEAVRRLAPRVAHVHVKNFVDDPAGERWPYRYCPPREGKVDYAWVVEQLAAAGYDGAVSFEPEGFPYAQAEDGIRYLAELLGPS
ncbi:MAG: sugar phosphate isomerase/epimerase family protein [Planctomycetota bacterium]